MKLLFGLLFSTVLVAAVWGWTAIEMTDKSTAHPGHCYSKNPNVGAMENGESKLPKGDCVEVTCAADTSMHYFGCGSVAGPPNCKVTEVDLTKPYPDCCPDIECP